MNGQRLLRLMISLWLVALFLSACGVPTTGKIKGTLTKEDGAPLPNVRVELGATEGSSREPQGTQTDAKGQFAFEQVKPGEYLLAILVEGSEAKCLVIRQLEVQAGDQVTLDFKCK
jgi:uncharacterized GH25 family protein